MEEFFKVFRGRKKDLMGVTSSLHHFLQGDSSMVVARFDLNRTWTELMIAIFVPSSLFIISLVTLLIIGYAVQVPYHTTHTRNILLPFLKPEFKILVRSVTEPGIPSKFFCDSSGRRRYEDALHAVQEESQAEENSRRNQRGNGSGDGRNYRKNQRDG